MPPLRKMSSELFLTPSPLPFLPTPLPDEIFGSWLGRLAVTNGLFSKSAFLKWLGVPKPLHRIVIADMVRPSESIDHVLSALGLTYADVLSRFSTRPYWECMHASGASDEEALIACIDRPPGLSFRGVVHKSDKDLNQAFLRVCPACLYDDWHQLGSCYFHRSHQLRGSRVCHKHGLLLLSNCPACNRPLGDVRNLLSIGTHCRCEADLTDERHLAVDRKDIWWRLAIFEHMCLRSDPGTLAGPGLLVLLRKQLSLNFPGPGRASARRALEQAFGEEGADWLRRTSRKQTGSIKRMTDNVALTASAVPVYSALFTACGVSFEEARVELAVCASGIEQLVKPEWRRNARPVTLDEARQRFLEFFAEKRARGWKEIRAERPFVFWLLALEDLIWLESQLPRRPQGKEELEIPSIDSDRALLACDPDLAIRNKLNSKMLHHAAVRAFYRDKAWLEAAVKASGDMRNVELGDALVGRLKQARIEHCDRTERPKRFTRRDAARGLNTSVKSLVSQAVSYHVPDSLLEEDIWAFRRRAIEWGVKKRLAEGLSLAPSMVCKVAGISTMVGAQWIAETIEDIRNELRAG